MLQSVSVTAMIARLIPANHHSLGMPPSHLPRKPLTSDHGPPASVARASSAPPEFEANDCSTWPRIMWDQEVVMPHDGHRIPASTRKLHGGKPSCWCVPRPLLSGCKQPAVTSKPRGTNPLPTPRIRGHQSSRGARKGSAEPASGG